MKKIIMTIMFIVSPAVFAAGGYVGGKANVLDTFSVTSKPAYGSDTTYDQDGISAALVGGYRDEMYRVFGEFQFDVVSKHGSKDGVKVTVPMNVLSVGGDYLINVAPKQTIAVGGVLSYFMTQKLKSKAGGVETDADDSALSFPALGIQAAYIYNIVPNVDLEAGVRYYLPIKGSKSTDGGKIEYLPGAQVSIGANYVF